MDATMNRPLTSVGMESWLAEEIGRVYPLLMGDNRDEARIRYATLVEAHEVLTATSWVEPAQMRPREVLRAFFAERLSHISKSVMTWEIHHYDLTNSAGARIILRFSLNREKGIPQGYRYGALPVHHRKDGNQYPAYVARYNEDSPPIYAVSDEELRGAIEVAIYPTIAQVINRILDPEFHVDI